MTLETLHVESIYVFSVSPVTATTLKSTVSLRGFERVKAYPLDQLARIVQEKPPALILLDPEGQTDQALQALQTISADQQEIPIIFLADVFDEALFLSCYDLGAKDFLIKPVNSAYLISRILLLLEDQRMQQQLVQRDTVLKDLGVIGSHSGVFTTQTLITLLKGQIDTYSLQQPLCLLMVALSGFPLEKIMSPTFKAALYQAVSPIIRQCCRGSDIIGEYFESKFAVVLPNTPLAGAKKVARRLKQQLQGYSLPDEADTYYLDVLIGTAEYTDCLHYETLLTRALESLKTNTTQEIQPVL